MKKVSVIVPVYFNQPSLQPLFERLSLVEEKLKEKNMEMELIFVDDGSKDNSFDELLAIKKQRKATKLVKLTKNFGSVRASKTGFSYVTGDCFMIMAADLQEPPELILTLVDEWLKGSKYILCARESREDPLTSKIASSLYYKLLRLFVVKDYPDGGYDIALMDKAMLPYMIESGKHINTPLYAYCLGFEPTIIRYMREKRPHGKSRWTLTKKLKFFIDSILGISSSPIRFVSGIGLFASTVSFLYGLSVIITALFGHIHVSGFAALAVMISFLLGLIIFMLGIIAEYLWRIFDESNNHPEVVIDEVYL